MVENFHNESSRPFHAPFSPTFYDPIGRRQIRTSLVWQFALIKFHLPFWFGLALLSAVPSRCNPKQLKADVTSSNETNFGTSPSCSLQEWGGRQTRRRKEDHETTQTNPRTVRFTKPASKPVSSSPSRTSFFFFKSHLKLRLHVIQVEGLPFPDRDGNRELTCNAYGFPASFASQPKKPNVSDHVSRVYIVRAINDLLRPG